MTIVKDTHLTWGICCSYFEKNHWLILKLLHIICNLLLIVNGLFLARMVIRLARFAPQTLRRIVRLSSDSSSSDAKFDNLAWLRPVPVPFDDAWAQLEAKINSGAAIADNPEVEEILRQLVTGHKPPPPPPRKLKHREETEFYKKLMEENPSIKLHLVVFYQKYFPEIGIRLSGWRKKNRVT